MLKIQILFRWGTKLCEVYLKKETVKTFALSNIIILKYQF